MDLSKEAIKEIAGMTPAQLVAGENGLMYYKRSDELILLAPPTAESLCVMGLESLCDYIKSNRDKLELNLVTVHVCSPDEVVLCSQLNNYGKRHEYLTATTENSNVKIGQFMSAEDMVIMLASSFVDNESRQEALKIVGNVTDTLIKTIEDTGLHQQISVKSAIGGRDEKKEIPALFNLAPYRTFSEIEQPESQFVLRARKGHNAPEFALFQFGGELWKLEAVRKIKSYLKEILGKEISVI